MLIAERFGPEWGRSPRSPPSSATSSRSGCGFKGGKGVATSGGILLALSWPVGLLALAIWLAVAVALRYSSLAAIAAAVAAPFLAVWLADKQIAEVAAVLALLVIVKHHQNIRRLARGEESKIKLSRS